MNFQLILNYRCKIFFPIKDEPFGKFGIFFGADILKTCSAPKLLLSRFWHLNNEEGLDKLQNSKSIAAF
jgi:hypothetical protein